MGNTFAGDTDSIPPGSAATGENDPYEIYVQDSVKNHGSLTVFGNAIPRIGNYYFLYRPQRKEAGCGRRSGRRDLGPPEITIFWMRFQIVSRAASRSGEVIVPTLGPGNARAWTLERP
ncbi:MAG: hypothetical protein C4576_16225 [Desulfobacteraceae bacterium]|nr:MAG: hypothetical protein C4576_16225 [Desulfobacteraceae bacterium]